MNVDGENIVAEMKCNVLNIEGSICYLVISSTPKYTEPQFEPRTAVVGISGCRLDAEGSFHVSDLSPKGMGIEADFEVSKGAVIRLNVTTQMGEIVVDGEVRYCRKMDGGRFRIGLSIQELSRIESAKWLKLLNVEDRAA